MCGAYRSVPSPEPMDLSIYATATTTTAHRTRPRGHIWSTGWQLGGADHPQAGRRRPPITSLQRAALLAADRSAAAASCRGH